MSSVGGPSNRSIGNTPKPASAEAPKPAPATTTPAAAPAADTTAPRPASDAYRAESTTGGNRATGAERSVSTDAPPAPAGDAALSREVAQARTQAGVGTRGSVSIDPGHVHGPGCGCTHIHGDGAATRKTDLGNKNKYDTTTMNSGKLNAPLDPADKKPANLKATHERLDADLKQAFPGGVEFNPPYNPADGADAADAKHALLRSANRERGAHQDRIVKMGDKTHAMSVDVSKAGKATVTMHGEGVADIPAASKSNGDYAAAKAKLEKDFGVTVSDTPKKFSAAELEKTHAAFSNLKTPEEKAALKGTTLERHTSIPGHADRSAEFESRVEVGPPPAHNKTMRVADSTFTADTNSFVGSGKPGERLPPSLQVLTHEAGHAVEAQTRDAGMHGVNVAHDKYTKQNSATHDAAKNAYFNLVAGKPVSKEGLAVNSAINAVEKHSAALANATTPEAVAKAEKDLAAARTKRDAALAKLPSTDPAHAEANALAASQDSMVPLARDLGTARVDLGKSAVKVGGNYESKRIQDFEAYTTKHNIKPSTDYGASSKQEFYAEAFSLYKTDPRWMEANQPKLYEYFQKQETNPTP